MKGLKIINQELRSLLKEKRTLLLKELTPLAEQIELDAKTIVPVDTGNLRDSINVKVSRSPRYPGIIATASAKNVRTGYDYAKIQHENPDYHHNTPGQYKYIEKPFDEAVEKLMEVL